MIRKLYLTKLEGSCTRNQIFPEDKSTWRKAELTRLAKAAGAVVDTFPAEDLSYASVLSSLLEQLNTQTTPLYALDDGDRLLLNAGGISVELSNDVLQLVEDRSSARWQPINGDVSCEKVKEIALRLKPRRGGDNYGDYDRYRQRNENPSVTESRLKYERCRSKTDELRESLQKNKFKNRRQEEYIDELEAKMELLRRHLHTVRAKMGGGMADLKILDDLDTFGAERDRAMQSIPDRRRRERFGDDDAYLGKRRSWRSGVDDD